MLVRDVDARLDRLASEAKGGGGLGLPSFFAALLQKLLDEGPQNMSDLQQVVEVTGKNKTAKLAETWGGAWKALTADLLDQLQDGGFVEVDGDVWSLGPNFATDVSLPVIPARGGLNRAESVTVYEAELRDSMSQDSAFEVRRNDLIRQPRKRAHPMDVLNALREDAESTGIKEPVIVAADGTVLDGRHRRSIDPNWPEIRLDWVVTEQDKLEAIHQIQIMKERWNKRELFPLQELQAAVETGRQAEQRKANKNQVKRQRVEAALLEDASRSNNAIAEIAGVTDPFVGKVREALLTVSKVHAYVFGTGARRPGKHSADCWCPPDSPERAAGDAQPKPKEKPRKAPTVDPYSIVADFDNGLDISRDAVAERYGVKNARTAVDRAMGIIEERAAAAKRQQSALPPEATKTALGCTHPTTRTVRVCDGCGEVLS